MVFLRKIRVEMICNRLRPCYGKLWFVVVWLTKKVFFTAMTETEIQAEFFIDRELPTPIYQQLEEQLRQFIRCNPPGTRLPSERAIAEGLKLSRQTIKNAINQLTEAGLLFCTRKGTFTAGDRNELPRQEEEDSELPRQSLAPYLHLSSQNTPLRLLLFENHPNQRLFWQKCVHDFNAQRHGVKAEIDFLTDLELPPVKLRQYLSERPADLLQFSTHFDQADLLARLPLDLQQELRDPAVYLTEHYEGAPEAVLTSLLPVYTNFFCCYFNQNLADRHHAASFADRLPTRELLPLLEDLRRTIPEPPYITGTIGDFILAYGLNDEFRVEEFTTFLEQLAEMSGRGLIHTDITMCYAERLADQFSGRQFFMLDWSGLVLNRFADADHRIGLIPLQPPPHRKIYGAASFLGIYRDSCKQGEATLFLNYLLSEPVQRRIVRELNTIPYHRGAVDCLAECYPIRDRAWWEATVSRISACRYGNWTQFVSREITDIFRDLLSGVLPLKRAVEKLQLRYAGRVKL